MQMQQVGSAHAQSQSQCTTSALNCIELELYNALNWLMRRWTAACPPPFSSSSHRCPVAGIVREANCLFDGINWIRISTHDNSKIGISSGAVVGCVD